MIVQGLASVHIDQLSSDKGSCRGQQETHQRGDLGKEENVSIVASNAKEKKKKETEKQTNKHRDQTLVHYWAPETPESTYLSP